MANWIWYPGDMELYYALKQNFSRVERGYGWPAFWKSEEFRSRVVFRRTYELRERTAFTVYSGAVGYVLADETKYPFGTNIELNAGTHRISVHAGRIDAFPSVFVQGEVIYSDRSWMAEDYASDPVPSGTGSYFKDPEKDPADWPFQEEQVRPVSEVPYADGWVYEFETEYTGVLQVKTPVPAGLRLYCGESYEEAVDKEHCYYSWQPDPLTGKCPACAFRYVFIPGVRQELTGIYQYVDIPLKASFAGDDEQLNQIWSVAAHTFRLCSGVFFIDGVKRDKWLWAGDAYQSLFVNRYLFSDPEIEQRTLLALRGNDPVTTHINTILDYSMLWLLGVKRHMDVYHDPAFLEAIFPKLESMMKFLEGQCREDGFLTGRPGDWVFIDWADLDKTGAFGAEQMLLHGCYEAMEEFSRMLGTDARTWNEKKNCLYDRIQSAFWDEEQGAFIDSFESGKRHVTRQTNLLAMRFHAADEKQKESILKHVILNHEVPAITTPYFAFFELDALGEAGMTEELLSRMRSYWGGMLGRGAVTFWEEFDESVPAEEQYDMYGDKFGKSLCHAWAASPVYLIGRYLAGVNDETNGFTVNPSWKTLPEHLCVTLPVNAGRNQVTITRQGNRFTIETDAENGMVMVQGERKPLNGETGYAGTIS